MSGSVFNLIKKYLFLVIGFALIFAANYIVFHLLFLSEGNKQVISWLQSESVDLQQGNLMTSFSKFDRVLAHKSDIRSIALLRANPNENFRILAQIGEASKFGPLPKGIAESDFYIQQKGPFELFYYARLPSDKKMVLAAKISSDRFALLTIINSVVISLILAVVNVWQSRFRRRQEEERNEFLVGTIKRIVQSPSYSDSPDVHDLKGISSKGIQEILFGLHRRMVEKDKAEATSRLAKQVAHDIRSPLSALNVLVGSVRDMPEEQRTLLKTVSRRINDIANNLLKSGHSDKATFLAFLTLDQIVSEKRVHYVDRPNLQVSRDFSFSAQMNFVSLPQAELARAISNIINNSVEAGATQVAVRLDCDGKWTLIEINDNGAGIAPDVLARLGERGFSHGKSGTDSGSGIGVHHARALIEGAGGKFEVRSELGRGTTIQIRLLTVPAPSWFATSIPLKSCSELFVVDDDQTIQTIWSERLRFNGFNKKMFAYQGTSVFAKEHVYHSSDSPLYLVDYEFSNQDSTGLDLIESLGIGERSVLVTSHFDDPAIHAHASRLRVKILPKQLADSVSIV